MTDMITFYCWVVQPYFSAQVRRVVSQSILQGIVYNLNQLNANTSHPLWSEGCSSVLKWLKRYFVTNKTTPDLINKSGVVIESTHVRGCGDHSTNLPRAHTHTHNDERQFVYLAGNWNVCKLREGKYLAGMENINCYEMGDWKIWCNWGRDSALIAEEIRVICAIFRGVKNHHQVWQRWCTWISLSAHVEEPRRLRYILNFGKIMWV